MRSRKRSVGLLLAGTACSVDTRDPSVQVRPVEVAPLNPAGGSAGTAPGADDQDEAAQMSPVSGMSAASGGQEGTGAVMPSLVPGPPASGNEPPPAGCGGPSVGFDTLFELARADVLAQGIADRAFLRYVSLTNQIGPGDCPEQLEEERLALTRALNMLSIESTIATPTAVNTERTLYRIDLRDLEWERAIQVGGQGFSDVWQAIAANNPFAVPFIGSDADVLAAATSTQVPLMFADQLLHTALTGQLYYTIVGVDVNAPFGSFIADDLAIDLAGNLQGNESLRAGSTLPGVTGQRAHVVQRDAIEVRAGVLWQSFELAEGSDLFTIQDLVGVAQAGGEAIFTLPNGLFAFLVFDVDGNVVEDSDLLIDMNLKNFRARSAVSCSSCHHAGLLPVIDEAREFALSRALELMLDREQVERIQNLYVTPEEFARVVDSDSNTYREALERTGTSARGSDPVSGSFFRFELDLQLADAAGDFGIAPDALGSNLALLSPVLGVLSTSSLDRDDFAQVFVRALCLLSTENQNRPDPNACDAATP